MRNAIRRFTLVGVAAAASIAGSMFISTTQAHADQNGIGTCQVVGYSDGGCLFYNSNFNGELWFFEGNVYNIGTAKFGYPTLNSSAGDGQYVKNDAASAWNNTSACMKVYYNSGYKGASDVIPPHSGANLSAT